MSWKEKVGYAAVAIAAAYLLYDGCNCRGKGKTNSSWKPSFANVDLSDRLTQTDSVFIVIDVSASMAGDPLEKAKEETKKLVTSLPKNKNLNVLAYGCDINPWSDRMQPATAGNKTAICEWIGGLTTMGGTGTGPAVASALSVEPRTKYVLLLTDGEPNCNYVGAGTDMESHLSTILSANTQGARIDTFGVGAEGGFEQFLKTIASKTKGRYTQIPAQHLRFKYSPQRPRSNAGDWQ